jgi:ABC-type transporter Mla subunit MlaD
MSRQAQVGLFVIFGLVAIFAVFFVLSDFGTRTRGYKIGIHFHNASGLHSASIVYLSGVPIGAVDKISLLPDYSTEVILAIDPGYEIPADSTFLIQAPITGEPTVLIEPPRNVAKDSATLPHNVLDIPAQPKGANPVSLADLLAQGQGEVKRLDDILAQFQQSEPLLIAELKATLANADSLTTNANRSLVTVTGQITALTASLQSNLSSAGSNVRDLTGNLDAVVRRDSGQVDSLLTQLNRTSRSFGVTVDSLRDVATNPQLKANLLDTTRDFALTAETFAEISADLRKVTGNQQTQAQLRDTVAELDATSQKVNSLVGSLGGTSEVYGVDKGATPAPVPASPGGSNVPSGSTNAPSSRSGMPSTDSGSSSGSSGPSSGDSSAPAGTSKPPANSVGSGSSNTAVATLRQRLNRFTADLVQLQIRAGDLAPLRPGSADRNTSPLLTADRGPQSDFNLLLLPKGATGLKLGANDIGSQGTTTANVELLKRQSNFTYGGGIEYSRLGLETSVAGRVLGFEARAYDLRHPTLDAYLNIFAAPKFQIFGGERDLTHASRRTAAGLQFEF